jgi:heterodisulfide reductase subunit C
MASEAKVVRRGDLVPDFAEEVIQIGGGVFGREMRSVYSCIQCGLCSGGCPSGRHTAMLTRELIRLTQLGLKHDVLGGEDLWQCTTCYLCQERCPRKVKTTDIIRVLRNLAVRDGHMSDGHRRILEIFEEHGHALPINEEVKAQRKRLGLREIPPTVQVSMSQLGELRRLLETSSLRGVLR